MDQIGFTFYPRDWWTSDRFIELELGIERYIYLELLFMMYMDARGVRNDREFISKKLRLEIPAGVWENATKSFNRVGDYLQSESVKKRRTRAEAARINGAKGGRPEGSNQKPKNPEMQTQEKPNENPKNPAYKEKEKEKRNRNITEPLKGGEGIYSDTETQNATRPALWGPSLRLGGKEGLIPEPGSIWDYRERLIKAIKDQKIPAELGAKTFAHFCPVKPSHELTQAAEEYFAKADEFERYATLEELAKALEIWYRATKLQKSPEEIRADMIHGLKAIIA